MHACSSPMRSWMEPWEQPMRQKIPPKMTALDMLLMARPMLVALSLLTWRLHARSACGVCLYTAPSVKPPQGAVQLWVSEHKPAHGCGPHSVSAHYRQVMQ